MLKFIQEGHKYTSLEPDNKDWVSITTLVHSFQEPFDRVKNSVSCSRKGGIWYGMSPEQIREEWDKEAERSVQLGKWYHDKREKESLELPNAVFPDIRDGVKYAPSQILEPGKVYPEHMVYLESVGICGQSDKVEVTEDGILKISDYKTSKKIRSKGFKNWEGVHKKLLSPVQHLEDCEVDLFALQLSMYAFIITRHNPSLKVGNLTIEHVIFVEDGKNKFDYPIYKQDEKGDYIVRDILPIELPYMKNECIKICEWLKRAGNREKVKKH